jgi:hypothetical protein
MAQGIPGIQGNGTAADSFNYLKVVRLTLFAGY